MTMIFLSLFFYPFESFYYRLKLFIYNLYYHYYLKIIIYYKLQLQIHDEISY